MNVPCDPATILPGAVGRYVSLGGLGLLDGAALIVIGRRMAGALGRPLSPMMLLTAGVLVAFAAAAIRVGWNSLPAIKPLRWPHGVMVLTSLAVALMGIGLCVSGTSWAAIVLLGLLLAGEEGAAWWWHLKRGRESFLATITRNPTPPTSSSEPSLLPKNSSDPFFPATVPPDEVTQQLTRSQAADGTEELAGWLRIKFAAGQRTGSLHVAFCPPFVATPELAVTQIDGPEARIKTAQRQPSATGSI